MTLRTGLRAPLTGAVITQLKRRFRGFAGLAATTAVVGLLLAVLGRLLMEAVALPDFEATVYVSLISGIALVAIAGALVPLGVSLRLLVVGAPTRTA